MLNEIERKLNSHGSAITPAFVRDESGVVFKRPSNSAEREAEHGQPPSKQQALSRPQAPNFRKICDQQTDTLDNLLDEQMKTNELLTDIRDGISNLTNAIENLSNTLISSKNTACDILNF